MSGYTVNTEGICIWPLHRLYRAWTNLVRIEFAAIRIKTTFYFQLKLYFGDADAKPVMLQCGSGIKNLRKIAVAIRLIQKAKPEVQDLRVPAILEILQAAGRDELPGKPRDLSDAQLLERAKLRSAALLTKPVIADCAELISRRAANECEAARLKIAAELLNLDSTGAQRTLDDILQRHPDEIETRVAVANYLMRARDSRGQDMAEAMLDRNAGVSFPLVFQYAISLTWQGEFDAAEARLSAYARARGGLSAEEKLAVDDITKNITRLRLDPKQAYKELVARPRRAKLILWAIILLIIGLFGWPLVTLGPIFAHEEWHLWQLRDHGIRADVVDGVTVREISSPNVELAEISYRYAPDAGQADPLIGMQTPDVNSPHFQADMDAMEKQMNDLLAGKQPKGWHVNREMIFKSNSKEIQSNPKLQYVTYLPEDPAISAIGPITSNRIWFTWIGAGKGVVVPVFVIIYFLVWGLYSYIKRRRSAH